MSYIFNNANNKKACFSFKFSIDSPHLTKTIQSYIDKGSLIKTKNINGGLNHHGMNSTLLKPDLVKDKDVLEELLNFSIPI